MQTSFATVLSGSGSRQFRIGDRPPAGRPVPMPARGAEGPIPSDGVRPPSTDLDRPLNEIFTRPCHPRPVQHRLELPFRHRPAPDRPAARRYVGVAIEEVRARDAPIAIRVARRDGAEHLRWWRESLVAPAVDALDGRHMTPREFERAVAADAGPDAMDTTRAWRFPPEHFPTRWIRWDLGSASPLLLPRGTGPAPDAEARAAATAELAGMLVSVDGVLHVAAPEPTLLASETRGQGALAVAARPGRHDAFDVFRLDRAAEAVEWLRLDGLAPGPTPEFEILIPEAIARDDEWAIATWIASACRRFDVVAEGRAADDVSRWVLHHARQQDPPLLSNHDAGLVLDGLGQAIDAAGGRATGYPLTDYGLLRCRQRWELAVAAGRGLETRPLLDASDAEALAGIV